MLADMNIKNETKSEMNTSCVSIRIEKPDVVREAVVDVVSFRALMRAVSYILQQKKITDPDDFDRALARVININGGIARVIEDGSQKAGRDLW